MNPDTLARIIDIATEDLLWWRLEKESENSFRWISMLGDADLEGVYCAEEAKLDTLLARVLTYLTGEPGT